VRNHFNIRATLIKMDTDPDLSVSMPILIDEHPKLIWDDNHVRTQTDFLNSIDPEYFRYLARVHEPQVEGDDSLNAAVVLRVTYSHALESLFAFIGAALQAPYGPAGWLLAYRIVDLQALIRRISGQQPFHNMLNLQAFGWDEVANVLLPSRVGDDGLSELRTASARLWKRLAQDMVDEVFVDEYNSLKHGLRARSGDCLY
jgi:hypothetical protein